MDTSRFNSVCSANLANQVFVATPGGAYQDPVSYSHYNQPLELGGVRGRSRKRGDASYEIQNQAISEILRTGNKLHYTDLDLAFALSVARAESGFNPDAAAGSSSASGIAQMIDSTAANLGVAEANRFDLKQNAQAFLTHLRELITAAKRQLPGQSYERILERAYGLYHDGPSLRFGGEKIAKQSVLPNLRIMLEWVSCNPLKLLAQ